jgi:hypothetical protein
MENKIKAVFLSSIVFIFVYGFAFSQDDTNSPAAAAPAPDSAPAQAEEVSGPDVNQVELMVRSGYFLNKKENVRLRKYASDLDLTNKVILFRKYQKNGTVILGSLCNLILPGTGSFLIGDYTSGAIISIGIPVCAGFAGLVILTSPKSTMTVLIGAGVCAGTLYLYGFFSPFIYMAGWNSKLKQGLGLAFYEYQTREEYYAHQYFKNLNPCLADNSLIQMNILNYTF